jgi:hypothetical protein
MLGACEFNHRAYLTRSVDRWNRHHTAPRPCVHTYARLTDHSFSSFNDMARPSGFLTDFDAAERLLDRRRTDGLVNVIFVVLWWCNVGLSGILHGG